MKAALQWRDTAWAMSEENIEIVRKAIAYEYDGVGDRAEAEAIFDPGVVLNPTDEAPSYGFGAMRSDMERWASAFEELTVTFEEIIDAGDQVVVVAHHQGRGRKSGVKVDTPRLSTTVSRPSCGVIPPAATSTG
jgi:ketosteroid isomerase-like protein